MKLKIFKSICQPFKGVNELTFAFGLINMSVKDTFRKCFVNFFDYIM